MSSRRLRGRDSCGTRTQLSPARPGSRPPARRAQEKPEGPLAALWLQKLGGCGAALVDAGAGLADAMSSKDEEEVKNVRKAAFLISAAVNAFAVPQIEGACAPRGLALAGPWLGPGCHLLACPLACPLGCYARGQAACMHPSAGCTLKTACKSRVARPGPPNCAAGGGPASRLRSCAASLPAQALVGTLPNPTPRCHSLLHLLRDH